MWTIIGSTNNETSLSELVHEYPEIVAYQDGSECPVYLTEGSADTDCLSGCGHDSRVLFWADAAASLGPHGEGDDGSYAIAEATWTE